LGQPVYEATGQLVRLVI